MAIRSAGSDFIHIVISVAISLVGGLAVLTWSLADPRSELKALRENFLSLREHEEFKHQITNRLDALVASDSRFVTKEVFERENQARNDRWRAQELINKQALDAFLLLKAFDAWREGTERAISRKQQGDDEHLKAFAATIETMRRRIDALERQLPARP